MRQQLIGPRVTERFAGAQLVGVAPLKAETYLGDLPDWERVVVIVL